ncbi:hypothetical protein IAI01_16615 [Vibrio cholerae]|uniref:hypothetical protein n=1 Tax=Vibrio cholerae TaxID=666 RepID=UPI0000F34ED7|nr:hypothetical protein [Vibrio cholerae]ACQ62805.1 hypothetical protein VCD_000845 [Vibrio cholerae MJ-1236]EAZ78705.1 hypothetical protein A5E_A0480 [Vibrio cholerae B33]EEO18423.1 hypothetical protein VCE_000936 [Vibrio cholerae B33]EMB00651.1 Hypothetical protein B839_38010 [Vibrio cholerae O1 str. Inaba G4222]KAA6186838.1 hypothetical protein F2S06_17775 [Vibrio cholerae O1 biovar El Tor]
MTTTTNIFDLAAVIAEYKAGFEQYKADNKQYNADAYRRKIESINSDAALTNGAYRDFAYGSQLFEGDKTLTEIAEMLKTRTAQTEREDEQGFIYPHVVIQFVSPMTATQYYGLIAECVKLDFEVCPDWRLHVGTGRQFPACRLVRKAEWYKPHNEKLMAERIAEAEKQEAERLKAEYFNEHRVAAYVEQAQRKFMAAQAQQAAISLSAAISRELYATSGLGDDDLAVVAQSDVWAFNTLAPQLQEKDPNVISAALTGAGFVKGKHKLSDGKPATLWVKANADVTATDSKFI